MERRKVVLRVWLPLAVLAAGLLALALPPLAVGVRCYEMHARGEHARASVVGQAESPDLVLRIESGSRAGATCTAGTNTGHWAAVEAGETLAVVIPPDREGTCVLEATLERSVALLWLVGSLVAVLLLGLAWLGIALHRTFHARPGPTTRFDTGPDAIPCPRCGKPMGEGYVPLLAGLHWREPGTPVGLPHALSGLPGTTTWRGRPRLHAYRCEPCEVLTLRYGRPDPSAAPR